MSCAVRSLAAFVFILTSLSDPAVAAKTAATVKVALLDMSSMSGMGMMGRGMMRPGIMGPGMMGGRMFAHGMMAIRLDQSTVKAGSIRFDVTNWSRSVVHEVLVVSVDNPGAPLPYDYSRGKVPEDQVKVLGEVADLSPNASGTLDLALAPGSYLLICNVAGHYAAGMAVPLSVTP